MRDLQLIVNDFQQRVDKSDKKVESIRKRNKYLHGKLDEFKRRLTVQLSAKVNDAIATPEEPKPSDAA